MDAAIVYSDIVREQTIQLTEDLEIKEDTTFFETKLNNYVSVKFTYDIIMHEFAFIISKQNAQSGEIKSIVLEEIEMSNLTRKFPIARGLIRKYTYMKSSKNIDIPFELAPFIDEFDSKAVLSVKENLYRKGNLQLDIRKCIKRDGKFIHTKDGVRIKPEEGELLLPKLQEALGIIKTQITATRDMILTAELFLIVQSIQDMQSQQECAGCKIDHGSQEQHMDVGGCSRAWEEKIKDFWESSAVFINSANVVDTAQKLAERFPNSPLVVSKLWEIETPTDEEKRMKAEDITSLNNNELFRTCHLIHQQQK